MMIDANICSIKLNYLHKHAVEMVELHHICWGENIMHSNFIINGLVNFLESKMGGFNIETPWTLDLLDEDDSIIDTLMLSEEQAFYIRSLDSESEEEEQNKRMEWKNAFEDHQKKMVADWNSNHKVGTHIEYRELMTSEPTLDYTLSDAYMVGGSTVVTLKNKSGCISIEHCKPVCH